MDACVSLLILTLYIRIRWVKFRVSAASCCEGSSMRFLHRTKWFHDQIFEEYKNYLPPCANQSQISLGFTNHIPDPIMSTSATKVTRKEK
jgi:uncharacterized protein (DUF2132 family)